VGQCARSARRQSTSVVRVVDRYAATFASLLCRRASRRVGRVGRAGRVRRARVRMGLSCVRAGVARLGGVGGGRVRSRRVRTAAASAGIQSEDGNQKPEADPTLRA
jgi:hypothetical protein